MSIVNVELLKLATWKDMAEIIQSVGKEMKRRNPIGINAYMPYINQAYALVDEIAKAEADNFTSEWGPQEPKPKKVKILRNGTHICPRHSDKKRHIEVDS